MPGDDRSRARSTPAPDLCIQRVRPAPPRRGPSRRGLLALAGAGGLGACAATGHSGGARRSTAGDPASRFPELTDQRHTGTPITPAERAQRRSRLGRLLTERGLDAYFCEAGATLTYLAGVSWGHSERTFGLVVFANGEHVWIAPRFEREKVELVTGAEAGGPIVTWEEDQYARYAFAELVAARGLRSLVIDPATRLLVRDEVRAAGLEDAALPGGRELLVALRGRKDSRELALLRRANELTQTALTAIVPYLEPGQSGEEVGELVRDAQRALGLERVWALSLVGPAAAYPHGTDGSGRLGEGDFLLIDTGGSFHGYQSDNTRTWVPFGRPSPEAERVWHAVRDAQRRAFDAIRPGVPCGDVDRAAREVIDRAGFGPDYRTFTHRLGHGIGLEGHEDPYFDRGSEVVLEPGMTLSNEPGIYLYGRFGVRLEDIVVVTEDGADHFGDWQAGPLSPGSRTEAR